MRHARVVLAHRAPDRRPIRVARGETVTLGDRDAEWPQFAWAVIQGGDGGWIPVALFDAQRGPATALADYDTQELTVAVDEVLVLHYELAQWWWSENASGAQGWVPARALERLDDAVASTDNMFD
jgi:hypothetical protein